MSVQQVTASEVRAWARRRGYTVGVRGHLSVQVVEAFNRAHRVKAFTNRNPKVKVAA
jgi:hypothetical protein